MLIGVSVLLIDDETQGYLNASLCSLTVNDDIAVVDVVQTMFVGEAISFLTPN
jgi:hypothetical protein